MNSRVIVSGFFTKRFSVWDRSNLTLLHEIDVDSSVFRVKVCANRIAVSMVNGNVNVYDILEEDLSVKYLATVIGNFIFCRPKLSVDFIPRLAFLGQPRAANRLATSYESATGGKWLLTSSFRGPIKLWNLEDASLVRSFGGAVAARSHWCLKVVYPVALSLQVHS